MAGACGGRGGEGVYEVTKVGRNLRSRGMGEELEFHLGYKKPLEYFIN